jgi:hypothetical protein
MKRSYIGVLLLCAVVFLDIVCTQRAIHYYYYEQYSMTVMFAIFNIVLFPIAWLIYKKEKGVE